MLDRETKREITFKAGEYNIEVTDAGGEQRFVTDQFTLTRNGKKIVDARWELAKAKPATPPASVATDPPVPASADPDRRAAEWVLSIGGSISIQENGQERAIGAVGDLPHGAFELTVVDLHDNPKVSDAGLVHFKDCKNLTVLHLDNTQVSDACLDRLADYPKLTHLFITKTAITEAGVKKLSAAFPGCKIEWDGGVIEGSQK